MNESLPRVLGRYALYDKIASGGMATVHIGRLLGPVGFARTVAIKRLHSHFAEEPEFVSMFVDEARLAARIRHPNVVPTLDVVAAQGELFLVMEYVQGESLSRLFRAAREQGTRIPLEIIVSIMTGVLHGLHAAHEARGERGEPLGIVHRDISPQNIVVGVDGVTRLLDFGIAKAAGRLQTTREGQLKGKVSYMAPEQILAETIDRRTDVYAASAVLWEMLTGLRLFEGENQAEILRKVLVGSIDPPSKHVPGLPAMLDSLTLHGLSFGREARFATARDMARALEDIVPPVVASRIGEWVEAAARDVLAERSRLVEKVESDSEMRCVSLPQPMSRLPETRALGRQGSETSELTLPPLAGLSTSSPSSLLPARRTRRARFLPAGLGVGALACLLVALLVMHRHRSMALAAAAPSPTDPLSAPSASIQAATPAIPEAAASTSNDVRSTELLPQRSSPPRRAAFSVSPVRPAQSKKAHVYDHM